MTYKQTRNYLNERTNKIVTIAQRTLAIGTALFLLLSANITAGVYQKRPTLDTAEIRETHRLLAEQKRQMIIDQRFRQELARQAALANTQTNYDVLWYDIHILTDDVPDVAYDTLYGEVKFYARATEDGVNEVQIDFNDNSPIDSIIAPSGALSYSRSGDIVTVILDRAYDTDEQFEFQVFCRSTYYSSWRKDSDTWVLATYSEPYSARNWWP